MLRSFATTTPKLRADLTGLIGVPAMSKADKRDGFLNLDVMCRNSVLSSFSLNDQQKTMILYLFYDALFKFGN